MPNPLVDTSTVGSYVVFGKDFSFSFTMINSITKFNKVIIKGLGSGDMIISEINKNYSLISKIGIPAEIKLTKDSDIFTLFITNITIDLIKREYNL